MPYSVNPARGRINRRDSNHPSPPANKMASGAARNVAVGWTVTNQRAPRISARRSRAALAPSEVSHARSRHRNGHSTRAETQGGLLDLPLKRKLPVLVAA